MVSMISSLWNYTKGFARAHKVWSGLIVVVVIGGGYLLEGVGGGIIDYNPLLKSLQSAGYSGVYSLEFPGRYGDMDKAVKTDVKFVKKLQLEAFSN